MDDNGTFSYRVVQAKIIIVIILTFFRPPNIQTYTHIIRDMICIDEVNLAEAKEQGKLAGLVLVDHNKLTEPLQGLGEVSFSAFCVSFSFCLHFRLPFLIHPFLLPLFSLKFPFPSLPPSP